MNSSSCCIFSLSFGKRKKKSKVSLIVCINQLKFSFKLLQRPPSLFILKFYIFLCILLKVFFFPCGYKAPPIAEFVPKVYLRCQMTAFQLPIERVRHFESSLNVKRIRWENFCFEFKDFAKIIHEFLRSGLSIFHSSSKVIFLFFVSDPRQFSQLHVRNFFHRLRESVFFFFSLFDFIFPGSLSRIVRQPPQFSWETPVEWVLYSSLQNFHYNLTCGSVSKASLPSIMIFGW